MSSGSESENEDPNPVRMEVWDFQHQHLLSKKDQADQLVAGEHEHDRLRDSRLREAIRIQTEANAGLDAFYEKMPANQKLT